MATLIFKNNSASLLAVDDLGLSLEAGQQVDLIANFRDEDLLESQNLESSLSSGGVIELDSVVITYQEMVDFLTKLNRHDTIDYAYISGKDATTDITGAELERLTNGSDVSSGTELHNHDTRYYTKTNLQTSGSASVHWGNITNVPAFGSLNWKDPVDRSDSSYGSGTALPLTANVINDCRMVRDDGDGKPAQYVCVATSGAWEDQWKKIADIDWGSSNSIAVTAQGNLSSTNVQSALYELQTDIDNIISGTTSIDLSLDDAYNHGSVVVVDTTDVAWQLSDGRAFSVSSDAGVTKVLDVAAGAAGDVVTINGKLDVNGGAINLDATGASNFTVAGNTLTLSTTTSGNISVSSAGALTLKDQNLTSGIAISQAGTTGLVGYTATSIVGALNEVRAAATGADTMDETYDGPGGAGSGRVITVDSGAVKLDATSGSYAPIELTQQSAAPTSGLAAGQISFINGTMYAYDGTRTKWLSVTENIYHWSDSAATGKIMQIGGALDIGLGFKIPQNATIVKITVWSSGGNASKGFEVRKNGSSTPLKSFALTTGSYTSTNDNVDLNAGDVLQIYVSSVGSSVLDPVVSVYLKWRV
jgi:glycine cleavage system H lipoate-binding protein